MYPIERIQVTHSLIAAMLFVIAIVAVSRAVAAQDVSVFNAGSENQLGLTFSPDGKHAFWVEWNGKWGSDNSGQKTIYTSHLKDGNWSEPQPAMPSHRFSDGDPFISPDGQWLYFVSDRPVDDADETPDTNIWRYSLAEEDRLEYLSVNSESEEYSPVATSSGALYFASDRDGGFGRGDLYRAPKLEEGFGAVENLGPAVNSPTGEWNLWVSADETELIFEASSRSTNVSVPGDLYYSWRTPMDWTAVVPIKSLNTADSDLMPRLHPDANTLYYTTAPIGGHARIVSAAWEPLRAQLRADNE